MDFLKRRTTVHQTVHNSGAELQRFREISNLMFPWEVLHTAIGSCIRNEPGSCKVRVDGTQ